MLAPAWGSWATYGAARGGGATGEGQLSAAEMIELYDVAGIGPDTRLFALIGGQVSASPSPAIHRAGYRACGIDARYVPIEVDDLDDFAGLISTGGLALVGFATTMPFKEQVAARCRIRDALSEASGAANTVVVEGDAWHAHNTDGPAALSLVREHVDPAGKHVVVLWGPGEAEAARSIAESVGQGVSVAPAVALTNLPGISSCGSSSLRLS